MAASGQPPHLEKNNTIMYIEVKKEKRPEAVIKTWVLCA